MSKRPKAIHKPPARIWSVSKAISEARRAGYPMSRPTVISLCRKYGAGYQITEPHGWWKVYADKFMKLIKGEL